MTSIAKESGVHDAPGRDSLAMDVVVDATFGGLVADATWVDAEAVDELVADAAAVVATGHPSRRTLSYSTDIFFTLLNS